MTEQSNATWEFEPERYELLAAPAYHFGLGRRQFFKALGGGLVIACMLKDPAVAQETGGARRRDPGQPLPEQIGAWLHIGEDGLVTVFTGKVEIGQNIRTSLAQAIAEELRAPLASIRLVMGDTDLTPFDMGTFGSRTTASMSPQLRKVAAAAREHLMDRAAEHWNVDRASLVAADGIVTHGPTQRSVAFAQLTKGQKLAKAIGEKVPVTPPEQWKIAGKSHLKVDGRSFVTGKHRFTSDMKRPGMLYGKILRPSALNATLVSLDAAKAEALPHVRVVRDGDFVGIAAPNSFAAEQAISALQVEWKPAAQSSEQELFTILKKSPSGTSGSDGRLRHSLGSIKEGMAAADQKLEQTYTVAYIAHAPLEPRAAVAEWHEDRLTVWTGTQRPFGVRRELAEAFRIPENRVRVIVPDTGSGYGGKHTGEAAIEAARLSKAAGKPVKLVWTRAEEFTWAYFRPAGVIDIASGVSRDGKLTAWEFHNYNSGASAIRPLYEIPNQQIEFHPARAPLRQGSYRALAATANHFAREVHMDELAATLKMDALEFRLKNLKDPRLRAVFEAAAKAFGWGKRKAAPNQGFGIAGGFDKGGYIATCAEISVERPGGKVKIARVTTAFECGTVINPDHLKNQIEGAVVMGLGGALFEAIHFDNGKILNAGFTRYRVPRFSDTPILETILIDRKDLLPAGAGETPIVGLAPAVSNALFDATGIRLRSLPMVPNGLAGA